MYNPYTPYQYQNPYTQQNAQFNTYNSSRQEITKVNGEGGAKAYQMPPNSSVLLLDESEPLIWLKQTDGAGYPSISAFKITPYQRENISDNLERRIKRLEELILSESNTCDTKQSEPGESIIKSKSNQSNNKQ